MNKPILLLKKDLVKPISQALERINEIHRAKATNNDSIIIEGLFVLAISSFENSLNDTLRVLLLSIPDKLDVKTENISKKELIDGNPLKQAIENKVQSVSYKNLKEILSFFTTTTDIKDTLITEDEFNALLEIKATRNLLIHNNLVENDFYLQTAGPNKRSYKGGNNRLSIDQNYLYQSLDTLKSILTKFHEELSVKYVQCTRIKAIKALFHYIFKTPVMVFENEFEVDEAKDVISCLKESTRKESLSSSERFYYDMWVAHSHGNRFEFNSGQFFSISNRDKLAFFINNIDLLKS